MPTQSAANVSKQMHMHQHHLKTLITYSTANSKCPDSQPKAEDPGAYDVGEVLSREDK